MTQITMMAWLLTKSWTSWCDAKWTLGRIIQNKANGGDGSPADIFKILKEEAVKVLHSLCQPIWITQQ